MQKAKLIVQEYNENGIDSIEDASLRKRIEQWEQKYDRYAKALEAYK